MSSRPHVCFVCGSLGAESGLRIKPHDRLPYFPFLEHHDPPKGARLPTSNGVVDCCRVCYAFLTQQWETYERSKTPAIKRLYWLKRADNGHFTGAEMRLQGEYIAQIMGLNYQPGVEGRGSPDNSTRDYPPSPPYRKEEQAPPSGNHSSHGDQSLSYKSDTKSHVKPKLSSQPRVETPVLQAHHSSKSGHSEGVLDLTVRKEQKTKVTTAPSEKEQTIICYICAQSTLVRNCKYVSTARNSTSEPFFPVLQKISPPEGAFPLNQHGQAIVCGDCRLLLYQQWQAYELAGVPFQNRVYKLCDDKLKIPKSEPGSHIDRRPKTPIETDDYVCYLCGKLYGSDLIRLLYTVPPQDPTMGTLFFPFVQELQRPKGAQPLKSDGSVLSCRNCYAELYHQWQVQESMQIPVYQRKYSLSFATTSSREDSEAHHPHHRAESANGPDRKRPVVKSEATHPLNIHISEGMSGSGSLSSGGLLAIAVSEEKQHAVPTSCISPSKVSNLLKRPYENLSTGSSIPHPLEQAVSKPKKICFLCGERSRMMNTHLINAFPVTQETKSNNTMVLPFFPFLRNSSPAPGADPMTEEGSVVVCSICFHMLLKQWNLFEEYPNAETINRWQRRYVMPDFVCYVCAKRTNRKHVKMLEAAKFPFLKEIKCPPDSLILNGGLLVIACKPCALDLNQQFSEYERLKVPIGLRKYNWVQRSMVLEHGDHENYLGREVYLLCVNVN